MRQLGKCHNIQMQVRKAWPEGGELEDGRGQRRRFAPKKVTMFFKLCLNSVAITL